VSKLTSNDSTPEFSAVYPIGDLISCLVEGMNMVFESNEYPSPFSR